MTICNMVASASQPPSMVALRDNQGREILPEDRILHNTYKMWSSQINQLFSKYILYIMNSL